MLDVFIGSQGSGKSLTSIHYLFELIETVVIEDDKEKVIKIPRHKLYKRLITNVGGFKADLFREKSGNFEIEIIQFNRRANKEEIILLFNEQMKEEDKPQDERTPTLFIYDECQYALSTFSTAQANLADCEFISNFFSLQRHYGPCDFLLMTQSLDKVHEKYLGNDFRLFISLEYAKKKDPENEIIFDLYDSDAKNIITGGRNKINYKKTKMLIDCDGNEFSPFDLYVSGDGGRKPVKKKSYWYKYVYILIFLLFLVIGLIGWALTSMFTGMKQSSQTIGKVDKNETNTTHVISSSPEYNLTVPLLPTIDDKGYDVNSSYQKYVKEPYNNIDAQIMYRVFVMDNVYYIGTQLLTLEDFKRMVDENVFFVVSSQPVTKRSFYINLLIHQSVLNSFGIVKDFDTSNDKRIKSSVKNSQ